MGIIKVTAYHCERCQHDWPPRKTTKELPITCPHCGSPYWNKPRRKK